MRKIMTKRNKFSFLFVSVSSPCRRTAWEPINESKYFSFRYTKHFILASVFRINFYDSPTMSHVSVRAVSPLLVYHSMC